MDYISDLHEPRTNAEQSETAADLRGSFVSRCKRGNVAKRDKWGHCLCTDCTEFNRARWRNSNKSATKQAWKAANKDLANAYSRAWSARNPDARRAIEISWKARNADRVAAHNAKAGAKWSADNKGKRNAITRRRDAAKRQRSVAWADHAAIDAIYIEAARLTAQSGVPHEVDHIIPLQGELVSGLHVQTNLRVITRSANRSKRNTYEGTPGCAY